MVTESFMMVSRIVRYSRTVQDPMKCQCCKLYFIPPCYNLAKKKPQQEGATALNLPSAAKEIL